MDENAICIVSLSANVGHLPVKNNKKTGLFADEQGTVSWNTEDGVAHTAPFQLRDVASNTTLGPGDQV